MAIAILSGTPGTPGTDGGGTASVSFTIPSTIPDGSLIIAIHCNDFRDATNMVAPVLSGFSPTMNLLGTADGGLNLSHIKVWAFDYPVGATGSTRTLTCTETGSHDGDKGLSVYALSGAAAASSCLDGSLVANVANASTSTGSFVLSGVTTTNTDSLLITHIRTSNGAGTASITQPGSMTEQYDVANFTRFEGATEQLVASGATGTRTFTPASSVPFVSVTFAIKVSGGAATNANAESTSATGVANSAAISLSAPADVGVGTGAAFNATASITVNADTTTATGIAQAATAGVGPAADVASATGGASATLLAIQANAEATAALGAAFAAATAGATVKANSTDTVTAGHTSTDAVTARCSSTDAVTARRTSSGGVT